ncbi:hypothetical protein, partial [Streptomyces eurythermus]
EAVGADGRPERDVPGRARGGGASMGGHDEREQTLNQILTGRPTAPGRSTTPGRLPEPESGLGPDPSPPRGTGRSAGVRDDGGRAPERPGTP